jgi:tetratricopeptide (TPR) repeat protein
LFAASFPAMTIDEKLDVMRRAAEVASNESSAQPIMAELLTAYVRYRATDSRAWLLLGDALRKLWRFAEAERALREAAQLPDGDTQASAVARIGMLFKHVGHRAEAEMWFAKATADAYGASQGWIWIARGANLAVAGQFSEAEQCHRRAAEFEDYRDEAQLNLGYVLRAQRRYHEAVLAFGEALSITPDYPEAREALEGLSGMEEAMDLAVAINGDDFNHADSDLLERARVEAKAASGKLGADVCSVELMAAYVPRRPWDSFAVYLLGDSLRVIGRQAEAQRILADALELAPTEYRSYILARLGMIESDFGKHVEAEALFTRAIADAGEQTPAWVWSCRGANWVATGKMDSAEKCYRHAIVADADVQDQVDAYFNLALVLRSERRYAEAGEVLQNVLRLSPDHHGARDVLEGMHGVFEAIELAASLG